jgi:CheY-like chemotaxis protein
MVRTDSSDIASSRRRPTPGSFEALVQPSRTDPPESTAPIATAAAPRAKILAGSRILVVEDDPDARELVGAVLADAGAVVECASSVAEGFEAFGRFAPELLVSDIAMPDEDGYSLMRRVRALGAAGNGAIPAIAVSAFTRPEHRAQAHAAGFSLHMSKPVLPAELVASAQRLIASRHGNLPKAG